MPELLRTMRFQEPLQKAYYTFLVNKVLATALKTEKSSNHFGN